MASPDQVRRMQALTPRQIVTELDRYIVGQDNAKRAVAIALRNRWRRQQVAPELRDEIAPKNIIMIGPTGVGKTEIARRLAKLVSAPFLKIEASKVETGPIPDFLSLIASQNASFPMPMGVIGPSPVMTTRLIFFPRGLSYAAGFARQCN